MMFEAAGVGGERADQVAEAAGAGGSAVKVRQQIFVVRDPRSGPRRRGIGVGTIQGHFRYDIGLLVYASCTP
jgi:hypothetical protein